MTNERLTERTDGVTTERTIERGGDTVVVERRGGGGSALLILLLLAALAIGGYFLLKADKRDAGVSAAATDAAQAVESTADKAGEAIDKAVK